MSWLPSALGARWQMLGYEASGWVWLAVDLGLLLVVAAPAARRLAGARRGSPRELVALGLVGLVTVVLSATALGALGVLSNRALVGTHAALAVAVVAARLPRRGPAALREAVSGPIEAIRGLFRIPCQLFARRAWRRRRRAENALLAAILIVLGFYAVLVVGTLPLNYDSQTYRLSRIAIWLQEGSIAHFPTDESRQNWPGQNADLAMLWLVSFFPSGYPLAQAVQYLAGLVACGAVYELAVLLGWRRRWRLAAVAILLGAPSVAVQFFTTQVDLFVAATLAAGSLFVLNGLRRGRVGDWLLAGLGVGLALGAKVTALYLAPGLALLVLIWAILERCSWRRIARGAAWLSLPVVMLSGFNFQQNWRSYGNPFAPGEHIESAHGTHAPGGRTVRNLRRVALQVVAPSSNPWIPGTLREPLFEWLTTDLRADPDGRPWLAWNLPLLEATLDEDHTSFGILFALAVLAGGVLAMARLAGGRTAEAVRVVALFATIVSFVVVFCRWSSMNAHQFRYFALVAPFGALVATASFVRARSRWAAALLSVLVVGHLATAAVVGWRNEYHGLESLLHPRRSTHFPLWSARRELVDSVGQRPLRIGVAVALDNWIAPYLRTRTNHRAHMVREDDLVAAGSLAEHFRISGDDLLITSPAVVAEFALEDVRILPVAGNPYARQLALAPLAAGEQARPAVVAVDGLKADGWTAPRARFEISGWRTGVFGLKLRNATPLDRRVIVETSRGRQTVSVEPKSVLELEAPVAARDAVSIDVRPIFVPSEQLAGSTDGRSLGLLLAPATVNGEEGVYRDGWTAPRSSWEVENWLSGIVEMTADNALSRPCSLRIVGRVAQRRLEIPPHGRERLWVAVLPRDRLTVEVDSPFVPAVAIEGSSDERELGVLLEVGPPRAPHLLDPRSSRDAGGPGLPPR